MQQLSPQLPPRMEPLLSFGGNAPNLFIYFNKYISIYVVFFFFFFFGLAEKKNK